MKAKYYIYSFIVILVSPLQASLESILTPLPEPEPVVVQNLEDEEAQATVVETPVYKIDPITPVDLKQALEIALEERMGVDGRVTIVPMKELPDLSDFGKPFSITLVTAPARLSRNSMLLRFQLENEKGMVGHWAVPFQARLIRDVWFVKAHLRKGDIATYSDLEVRPVDLLVDPDSVPADKEILARHEYSRNLVPGRPLTWRDLAERSLISKGEMVEVVASSGLLAITTRAISRQDGVKGDIIVLRNLDSSRDFSARVVSENKVEVVF